MFTLIGDEYVSDTIFVVGDYAFYLVIKDTGTSYIVGKKYNKESRTWPLSSDEITHLKGYGFNFPDT